MWNHILSYVSYFELHERHIYYGYRVIICHSGENVRIAKKMIGNGLSMDKSQFFHHITFTIPIENVQDFISQIKSPVKIESKALCGLIL